MSTHRVVVSVPIERNVLVPEITLLCLRHTASALLGAPRHYLSARDEATLRMIDVNVYTYCRHIEVHYFMYVTNIGMVWRQHQGKCCACKGSSCDLLMRLEMP